MALGRYLTADLINELQTKMSDIQTALIKAGYVSPDIAVEKISYGYLPSKIFALFQVLERNTRNVDAVSDWINPYSSFNIWNKNQGALFNDVNRWFLWADYNIRVINNEQPKEQFLLDETGEEIYSTEVTGKEKIKTQEGYFKE